MNNIKDVIKDVEHQKTQSTREKIAPSGQLSWLNYRLLSVAIASILTLGTVTPILAQPASPGYTLLNKGWVDQAIKAFEQALQRNPRSLDDRLGLAIAYQKAGQDANAWNAYQQVLQLDPQNRAALTAVGILGSYRPVWQAKGIEALTTLLALNPNDDQSRSQRALLLGYQGRFTEAIADYQLVLPRSPKPEVILGAAQIYTFSGDYQEGLRLFDRYRKLGKTVPDNALPAYATALRETGNPAAAVQLLESRLTATSSAELRTSLALAYQFAGNSNRAAEVLEPLRTDPQATLPLARALSTIARQTGDTTQLRQAIDLYRLALKQEASPSRGLAIEFADVLSELPDTRAEALQRYQQIAQPDLSLTIKQLGLQRQLGTINRRELSQQLKSLLQPLPTSVAEQQSLARSLAQLEAPDADLLPVYQSLLENRVDVPFLNYRIAQMLLQTGDFGAAKGAIAAYQRSAIGAQDLTTELLLAEVERREAKLDVSAQRYEALVARNPKATIRRQALLGLAGIRQQQGRFDEAMQAYDQLLMLNPQDEQIRLGQVGLAYRARRITQVDAEAALNQWLSRSQAQLSDPPPELFSLVGVLPAAPQREDLYNTLLAIDPDNLAIQRRLIQVLAMRDPAQAKSRVSQMIERNPDSITAYFIQGELGEQLRDLNLASRAYETIVQRQPDNLDALSALGGVRFQQRRLNEARLLYRKILALKPDWETRRILAEIDLAQDQAFSALHQLRTIQTERAAKATPDSQLSDRIIQLEVDRLKRRGFQPAWERY
ncbi:tetratricopeptide repeat protein [Phormidesmis sp. 146-12]